MWLGALLFRLPLTHCPKPGSSIIVREDSPPKSFRIWWFGVTLNDSHLPWELHLARSCRETAGPAGARRSPPARHRHSRPHRCCSRTAPSAPPRPAPTAAMSHISTPWTADKTSTECSHSRGNPQRTVTKLRCDKFKSLLFIIDLSATSSLTTNTQRRDYWAYTAEQGPRERKNVTSGRLQNIFGAIKPREKKMQIWIPWTQKKIGNA